MSLQIGPFPSLFLALAALAAGALWGAVTEMFPDSLLRRTDGRLVFTLLFEFLGFHAAIYSVIFALLGRFPLILVPGLGFLIGSRYETKRRSQSA